MTLHEILEINSQQFNSSQTIWSFYITVSIGIIAYIGATPSSSSNGFVRFLLAAGFIIFAVVNLIVLERLRAQRNDFAEYAINELKEEQVEGVRSASIPDIERMIRSNETKGGGVALLVFHISCDIIVIGVIWFVPGILKSSRKLKGFSGGKIDKFGSPFDPVKLSREEQTGIWILEEQYEIAIGDWRFSIPEKFKFDLASVPKPFWWIIAPFELSISAPLVHDFAYSYSGKAPDGTIILNGENSNITRKQTDLLFLEIMRQEKVAWWRRKIGFYAVYVFGGLFWKDEISPELER